MTEIIDSEAPRKVAQEIIPPGYRRKPAFWTRFIAPFGLAGILLFFIYAIAQICAGYIGIAHHWGHGWAVGALILGTIFRVPLPLTIGAYFCAVDVWGWYWPFALAFAAPGLVLFVLALGLSAVKKD